MIDLEKLYNLVIDDDLTTKSMKENDFSSYDIKKLVKVGIIQRIQRGKYKLTSVDDLYKYGKDLICDGKREKAQNCFRKCYELDSKHAPSCFQMFFQSVHDKQYNNSYKYLLQLFSNSRKYENDYKLYLFLLGNIYELSNEDIEYTKILETDDVLIDKNDNRIDKEDLNIQNEIRYDIIEGKFSKALFNIQKLDNKHSYVSNLIMKELLIEVCTKNKRLDKKILELIKQKQYDEIIVILEKEQEKHRLSTKYDLALEICHNIEKMRSTNIIYEQNNNFDEFDINGMIYSNKYEKAIKYLEKQRQEKYLDQNILYMLMIDAIEIKNKILEDEKKLIDKIALLYKNKTFIVMNELTETQKHIIEEFIKTKDNILMKKFNAGPDEVLLLKYHENESEEIDYKLILQEANEFFKQEKYEESLNLYKTVLRSFENPKAFIYGSMGALYYKLSNKKLAKLCYFIADMVGREENNFKYYQGNAKFNPYSKQIYQVHMKESDFYDDLHDYYGLDEIAFLVESKKDFEEVISEFDLSSEQQNILKLIITRNYYSQKNFKVGDKLYIEVEKSKEKTPFVKELLKEIKTNKKLYQYRSSVKQLKK